MEHSDFVHLHLHTEYSLLDGGCKLHDGEGNPGPLFKRAQYLRMPALAITDHGNMYGVVDFYKACSSMGIKPIIGCEVYVAPQSRHIKQKENLKNSMESSPIGYHLVLLAKDEIGYRNLMKLVSIGYLEGFYYRPRIDYEVLEKYSDGLIGLSCCLKGEIPALILRGNKADAAKAINRFRNILGEENFYLEMQDHGLSEERDVNRALIELSRKTKTPLVATNDCHYVNKEDSYAHEILLCIGTGKTLDDPDRMKFSTEEFYLKSPEEMKALFHEVPEAIKNTLEIIEKCNVQLDFDRLYLPDYKTPKGETLDSYLSKLCQERVSERYPERDNEVKERLEEELGMISNMGFSGYFLIVWDFIQYAKKRGIPVGPGRGSGAGSIVAYILGITDVDPLKYGLLFERFLNPGRRSMPDLDIDFADEGRDEVIEYVKDKYGSRNVAQIITFGSMHARQAIRDVGRVLNVPLGEVDKIAKMIPFGLTIYEALKGIEELKKLYKTNPMVKQLIETAQKLEGIKRHSSVHAAGLVIAPDDMTNYVPFAKTSKDVVVTQYEGNVLVKLGLLKIDFLGLKTLTIIEETQELIREQIDPKFQVGDISLKDEKTYTLLQKAEAIGVFQLESTGMRDLLQKLKPTEFNDIIAILALFRPGPIGSGMVDDFIKRKHGYLKVAYEHPLLEPILKNTYGVILYQEDVMRIAADLGGFEPEKADLLRKAMGKKIPEEMEKLREDFLEGTKKKAITTAKANKIFDAMAKFGGYGFNKSHATAYALLAYRTAYLKANYPHQFVTALLNSEIQNSDKLRVDIGECEKMGIGIKPPCVQKSSLKFTMDGESIRFGLLGIKNVGQGAIESVIKARNKGGRFKNFSDFAKRVDLRQVNRKVLESLIKSGAFDDFNKPRAQLFASLDYVLEKAGAWQKDRMAGQTSFINFVEEATVEPDFDLSRIKEWPESKLLSNEKEVLGFYITGHPLARFSEELKNYSTKTIQDVLEGDDSVRDGMELNLGGIITHAKKIRTKKGDLMGVFKLEDLSGSIEVVVFPKNFNNGLSQNIRNDELVVVRGKVSVKHSSSNMDWERGHRLDEVKIYASDICPLSKAREKMIRNLILNFSSTGLDPNMLNKIKELVARHRGDCSLSFNLVTPNHGKVKIKSDLRVKLDDELLGQLEKMVGKESIELSR